MTAVASLNEASLLATPLAMPPFEAPLLLLPDGAPLVTPDADSSADPELEPAAPLPLAIAEPEPNPVVEAPLVPPAPAPLVAFWAGPGPVWVALQAAATKTAEKKPCWKEIRLTSYLSGGLGHFRSLSRPFQSHPATGDGNRIA